MEIRAKSLGKMLRELERSGHAEIVALMAYSDLANLEVQGTKYILEFVGGEYIVTINE